MRDKYRTHAWFCVGNTTPFDRLPAVLLSGAEPAEGRGKEGTACAAFAATGAAADAAAAAGAAAAAARGRH